MAEDPKKILGMNDVQLQEWALSGDAESYVHQLGQTAMNMRCAIRMAKASEGMALANQSLVSTTKSLARYTKHLVMATWGVVIITLLVQLAIMFMALWKK